MQSLGSIIALDRAKHCYRVAIYANVEVLDEYGTSRDFAWVDMTEGRICFYDWGRRRWKIERGSFQVVIKKNCEDRYS